MRERERERETRAALFQKIKHHLLSDSIEVPREPSACSARVFDSVLTEVPGLLILAQAPRRLTFSKETLLLKGSLTVITRITELLLAKARVHA